MSIWASVDRMVNVTSKDEHTGSDRIEDPNPTNSRPGWIDVATCGWHDAVRLTVNDTYGHEGGYEATTAELILSPDEAKALHDRLGRALGEVAA